jgi:flagellar protein FliO/FliZ
MDLSNYLRFVAALAFVLALIGFATWLARRYGVGGRAVPGKRGDRRLGIVEIATIDAKHRAVLIRRDDREHLLLIGGASDLVIETGIVPPARDSAEDARDSR